ncbi:MAG: hypothetical protein H0X46_03300 [Bacteroidetes bacterium]|nr:hypothetical protein [Bacteroidota bacterium]
MNKKYKFLMGLKIVGGITLFVIVFGFGTMHLWNWLVPSLFQGPIITFAQAIGLLVLSKILFGGFGHKHRGGRCGNNGNSPWGWKNRMKERMSNMTPEEKEEFKKRFKDKCGSSYWMKDNETETNEIK